MSSCVEVVAVGVMLLHFAPARVQAGPPLATFDADTYSFLGNRHVVADVNGDHSLDLVGTGLNAVAVTLNNGEGAFGPNVPFPAGGPAQDVAAGDFNEDGKVDLAVTLNSPDFMLSILIGNGNGTFNAPVLIVNTTGADSPSIIADDVNDDGNIDLVIVHQIACFTAPCLPSQRLSVLLGNGNGTFEHLPDVDVGTGMAQIAVGDFNRDRQKDLAICGDNTRLYILLGKGDGTFVQQPTIFLVPGGDLFSATSDVDVADFDGDMTQDLAAALPGNGRGTAILIGNGNGTFAPPFRILDNALDAPQSLAIADYNRDGFDDIARALGNGKGGLFDILYGNGNATFQPAMNYLVPPPLSSIGGIVITSANFNADTKPDLALSVGGASPSLRIAINSTPVPQCPANIVTQGASAAQVDVDDLIAVVLQWGPCPPPPAACQADIDESGEVDVDDLIAVILAWGACP